MTRQCPDAQTVSSSNRNPAGVHSNTVEVSNIDKTERLRTLADTTECSNEIELTALEYDYIAEEYNTNTSVYATWLEMSDCELENENNEKPQQRTPKEEILSWICSMLDDEDDDIPDLLSISNSSLDNDISISNGHKSRKDLPIETVGKLRVN
jgi:hypothetical protein